MGALLNNSNGCPRMPIRNTTAIKAVSILGAEWRPCSKWRHYSCYPPEDAAALVFLLFLLVVDLFLYLFSGCKEGEMFRFWSRTYLRGKATVSLLYPHLNRASLLAPRWNALFETGLGRKTAEAGLQQYPRYKHAKLLPQPPPALCGYSNLSMLLKDKLLISDRASVVVWLSLFLCGIWNLHGWILAALPVFTLHSGAKVLFSVLYLLNITSVWFHLIQKKKDKGSITIRANR